MEGEGVEHLMIEEQSGLEEEDGKGIVSKTRWVVKTGLRLGKKVVITGILVSSVPLFLPPLITISVLGFVVLVPVGFVLAGYACTEKLMSKLLPMPAAPPLMLEYHSQAFRDGNGVEELYGRESRFYEGEFAMEAEKKEEGVELVMDSVVAENEEGSQYVEKHYEEMEKSYEVDKKDINMDENLEKGYEEEDEGEYMEGEDDEDKKGINIDENLDEGYEEAIGEYLEGEQEDEKDNIEENLERGYEEDVGEYLEAEHVNIDENLDEVYEEAIGEYLEGEGELEKDNTDENLEKGYEDDVDEYLDGEHVNIDENLENEGYEEAVGESLEGEHVNIDDNLENEGYEEDVGESLEEDNNLEKGYEEDAGEYLEGEHEDKKEISIDEDLKEEGYEEDVGEYLEGEHVNIDENLENEGYEEAVGESLEGEHVNIDENLENEGYEEAVGESLEGEHVVKIDESLENEGYEEDNGKSFEEDKNLEKGYVEDAGEYLEGEHEDNKEINNDENVDEVYEEANGESLEGEHEDEKDSNMDENLEKGYEEDAGEYLEGEQEVKKEINIDEELKEEGYEEDVGEYLEGEHEGPMPEMNMETERGREELHCEFGENVKRTEGLDLVATSARGENYNHDEAEENFEFKSVSSPGDVGSSVKEDEEHLEKPSGFEEEDKKDATSTKGDENPFNSTEAKLEKTVAVVKENEGAPETEKQGNGGKGNAAEQVSPEHNEINGNNRSSEVILSEEKIWEQISAIRGILGYTAAPQSSTVDELKALFILTGVEPPSPFEDPSDLADVNEKLRLLMSIVGTK